MAIKLEVKNLYKVFGDHPEKAFKLIEKGESKESILAKTGLSLGVKNASLAIEEGEIFVIMGLSGSGKSTMVRLLNRLIEPTRGQVIIDGVDIAKISDAELRDVRRNKISMVFQSFALMPHMTVLNNTAFGMELAGVALQERQEKALDALRQVGLENYAHAWPDELSGGMRQRVGLARALAINPDILLMDEAFSALDPLIRTEMQDELVKLQAKHQRTIVFISHDLDEAMRIGAAGFGPRSAIKLLQDEDREYGYVLEKQKFIGVVSTDSLKAALAAGEGLDNALLDAPLAVPADTSLNDLLSHVAQAPCAVPVIGEDQQYVGIISKSTLLRALDREGAQP